MAELQVDAMESFKEAAELAGPVMDNVNRAGYDKPTPVQKHALPILCKGYDEELGIGIGIQVGIGIGIGVGVGMGT